MTPESWRTDVTNYQCFVIARRESVASDGLVSALSRERGTSEAAFVGGSTSAADRGFISGHRPASRSVRWDARGRRSLPGTKSESRARLIGVRDAEVRYAEQRDGKCLAYEVFGSGPSDVIVFQNSFPSTCYGICPSSPRSWRLWAGWPG